VRIALKTATYSVMHFVVAITVAYAVTQDWRAALAVGLIEPAVQTGAFLAHDRAWAWADRRKLGAAGVESAPRQPRAPLWKALIHAHP